MRSLYDTHRSRIASVMITLSKFKGYAKNPYFHPTYDTKHTDFRRHSANPEKNNRKIPWLVQESSVPGLHNAGTQVHSMEGSQIARQWQPKTGTRIQKQHIGIKKCMPVLTLIFLFKHRRKEGEK